LVFLKSKTYGRFLVAQDARRPTTCSTTPTSPRPETFRRRKRPQWAVSSFLLLSDGSRVNGLRWNNILRGVNNSTPGQNGAATSSNTTRPTTTAFVLTASWGEDDMWARR